ncbi:MAG: hypothetical protein WC792_06375 [Candidatus Micrarchaeia archaeon]|jgi:hypothetical protein
MAKRQTQKIESVKAAPVAEKPASEGKRGAEKQNGQKESAPLPAPKLLLYAVVALVAIALAFLAQQAFLPQDYYGQLKQQCLGKSDYGCCASSVDAMKQGGYLLAGGGSCPAGAAKNMLKCIESYSWCEPIAATPTPTPTPAPCITGTIKERQCVGIWSGKQTWYECVNGKWQSRSAQGVPECNENIEVNATTPTPKNSSVLMSELRAEVEKIIKNVLNQSFSCNENSLNYRREFTCNSKRTDGYVGYSFKALNFGEPQSYPAGKTPVSLGGRPIIYERHIVGTTETVNVYMLCHANQTLLQYIVPSKDDPNRLLTNTLAAACPQ